MTRIWIFGILVVCILFTKKCFGQNDTNCVTVVNNDFANRPFGKSITVDLFLESLECPYSLEKRPINNIHNGDIDTIYCYKFFESEVTFYRNSESFSFRSARIRDGVLRLKNGIAIGNSKAEVVDKIKLSQGITTDCIVITDEEDYAHHKLLFDKNKIAMILLNSGLD